MIKKFLFKWVVLCVFGVGVSSCAERVKFDPDSYVRPIEIVKLSENNYQHISYLKLSQSNFYPCNGYVYISDGEAVVFDSPVDETSASHLIHFLQNDLKVKVKGVVVNHFHADAAGGLGAFAKANIPSYASSKTAEILRKDGMEITHPFDTKQELKVGSTVVENTYFGPAHTHDNIVSYIPDIHLLYGGCMIKSLHAGKGNLKDANVQQWPKTVSKIKEAYPDVEVVIPGHGGKGDASLLDHTIHLFFDDTTDLNHNLE